MNRRIPAGVSVTLAGKVAFVTGASRGIGAAIAVRLAEAGADLALTARDRDGLARTEAAIKPLGVDCWTHGADLASHAQVRSVAGAALRRYGRVDILVNNAGITFPQRILDIGLKEWRATLDVNLLAPMLLAQAFAPGMIERRSGKIINISSQAGIGALDEHAAYSASKAGLHLLTKTMAVEFGPHNIQANCIAPTIILTDMAEQVWPPGPKTEAMRARIPLGRFGQAAEVADAVLFLASPLSDFITGEVLSLDGGFRAR
jgi:NAD(P)-dependent dehydrogenase (short-subunit alcohol dehydrogenase family)